MAGCVTRVGLGLGLCLGLASGAARAQYEISPWSDRVAPPSMQWVDIAGRSWSPEPLVGKAVVINFWATWCAPCLEELPSLQTLAEFNQGSDVQVLTVNVKDPLPRIQLFVKRQALTVPVVSDRNGDLARQWGVKVYPTTVLLSAQGKPVWRVEGAVDWTSPQAGAWIRRLQETAPVKPTNPATPARPRS